MKQQPESAESEPRLPGMLARLAPKLDAADYVFVRLEDADVPPPAEDILASFREDEGTTLIMTRIKAEALRVPAVGCFSKITLGVYSSLQSVGLLAAVTARLAEARIPVNVVSAIHHDHLYVPPHLARRALALLQDLASRSGSA